MTHSQPSDITNVVQLFAPAPEARFYAIGDVHGCHALLIDLLDQIDQHAGATRRQIVFLGDYIDRGPDSAGVVSLLMRLQARFPGDVICLKGNHEDLLLGSLSNEVALESWLQKGGRSVLDAYGVQHPGDLPNDVLTWMKGLPTWYEGPLHYFVHAGLRIDQSLTQQCDTDRMNIRGDFISRDHDFGKFVVHGHTPQRSGVPDIRPFRVNLDTAAVEGGALTAGVFDASQAKPLGFLQIAAATRQPAYQVLR